MIYFVQPEGRPFIKIGYARNVGERLETIQTSCPEELILLGVLPGGFAEEAITQERFWHLHIRGEWFRYTKEIRNYIRAHTVDYQPEIHDPALKVASEDEAWKERLATVQAIVQDKRIRVWVQNYRDRNNLMLQWIDPEDGRRKSKSAGTMNRDEAEQRRADLEAALNQNGRIHLRQRNTSRNTGDYATPEEANKNPSSPET